MQKIFVMVVVVAMVLSIAAVTYAAPEPVNKLARGVANVLSAPLEVPKQITVEWRGTEKKQFGLVGGLFKGVGYAIKRVGSGALDILTFPFKLDEKLDPVMKPEYVFD